MTQINLKLDGQLQNAIGQKELAPSCGDLMRRARDVKLGKSAVPLWQKLLVTFAIALLTSVVAWLVWHWAFKTSVSAFIIGTVGGIAAAAVWRFLTTSYPTR